jgi:AraC-like DNA-binding protein
LHNRSASGLQKVVMPIDVLSDVLHTVHLTGAVYFDFHFSAPWVLEAPPSRELVGKVMPGAQRVMGYYVIARGDGWGHIAEHAPIRLSEGDLFLVPQAAHALSSAPALRATLDMSPFDQRFKQLPVTYELGGEGPDRARILCCFVGCDERPYNPLLAALPPVFHLSASDANAASGRLGVFLAIAAEESGSARTGGENVLSRISELMFVEAIRRYIELLPDSQTGWLAGLRDKMVGQALAAMHTDPCDPWTVERLARRVGLSRSVFAERFTTMVGHPPMHYLALWRMQVATRLLTEGRAVADTAAAVGYESEASFSRAFKKLVGHAPKRWRRQSASSRPEL